MAKACDFVLTGHLSKKQKKYQTFLVLVDTKGF